MWAKLFEILPDAEHLLSLEPEELAGPLLVSLMDHEKRYGRDDMTVSPNIIGYDNMEREIGRSSHIIPKRNYPHGIRDNVLFALMEAWHYLFCKGYIAIKPKNLAGISSAGTIPSYFITRRGKEVETLEDYEAFRKADLLRKHQLHHIIAEKVWSIFAQGSYDTAVLEAFKQVEVAVRKTGGYTKDDYGNKLMRKAFHPDDGKLTDKKNPSKAERQARADMFAGAIGAYKNPSSHENIEMTAEEAAEMIVFASHLLRIVDSCNLL